MATSDPRDYFNNRIAQELDRNALVGISDGYDQMQAASRQKILDLSQLKKQQEVAEAKMRESWVGKLGLNPDGVVGTAVNLGASAYSGVARGMGELTSLVPAVASWADENSVSEDEISAYNRKQQGIATPEDMALLTRKKAFYAERDTPEAKARAQEIADRNPEGLSALDLIERSKKMRTVSRDINEVFDNSSVVHQGNRDELTDDLGKSFQAAWDQTGLANTFSKDKEVGGIKDVISGVAKLLYTAGEAGITHPTATAEYISENLPQLVMGSAGKGGKLLMSASNASYAADNYQRGMQNYAAENNGELPSADKRMEMALWAASTAVAEQVGEVGQLAAIGKVRKSIPVGEEAARLGFKQSLKNTAKATATGFGEEAATEGFQTYAEGEASLKPASAQDVYVGGVIGGLSGGGISGGGRAAAEALGATPEKVAKKVDDAKKSEDLNTAISTGDVTKFLDPKDPAYSPERAVQALYGHSKLPETSEETKQASLKKATEIVADLEEQKAKEQTYYDAVSPAMVENLKALLGKAQAAGNQEVVAGIQEELASIENDTTTAPRLEAKLARIDRQLTAAQEALANFHEESQARDLDVTAEVAHINGADSVASQESADRVINLSMAIPERLDTAVATSLAENTNNALTAPQRAYLRAFSAARAAENLLKDMGKVSQEIYHGGKGMVGIQQYRASVAAALSAGNKSAADTQIAQLSKFVGDHQAKATVSARALKQFETSGLPVQVISDGKRGWAINMGEQLPAAELRKQGGVLVDEKSSKLVDSFKTEADALSKAEAELRAAYDIKFNTTSEVKNVKDVSKTPARSEESTDRAQTQAKTESSTAKDGGTAGERSTNADVQSSENAGVAKSAEKAPASSVTTAENQEQLQSTEAAQDTATAPVEESGKLSTLQQTSPEGTAFNLRNLVADYFTQSAGKESDATTRPLVEVKNFLTQTAKSAVDFLQDKTLSGAQQQVLQLFKTKASAWQATIQKNLSLRKREFWYTDMMDFLVQESEGNLDLEENVKTAMSYAAFSWIAENAGRSMYNTDAEIRAILDRDEDHIVSRQERNALGLVGLRQNVIANSLGQRAVQALGLKENKDAPKNLMPRLEGALGAHIMKMMLDQGMLKRTEISGKEMAAMTGKKDTNSSASFQFISLVRDEQGNPNAQAKEIMEASKGTQGMMDKLFSVEASLKAPTFEPVKFTQTNTRNTDQKVPENQAKIIEHENQVPNFVRQDMWQLITQLSDSVREAIAGVEEVSEHTHVVNKASVQAKNDGLKRELERFVEFVSGMDDIEAAMYFEHSVWKQQRVGISTNVINPQSSKIHRFMLYRNAWTTKVDMANDAQMDNFRLRVLEGLGVKTDKQSNQTSLAGYQAMVNQPAIADAVEVLRKSVFEGGITAEEQQVLVAGVKAGKQKFHSLDALMALAHEAQAMKEGKDSFTVQMMGEVDGVTNGPMLSHLMLGASETVEGLFGLLNRGGFFEKTNDQTQYNQWREQPGHLDLYENTALHMTQAVQAMLDKDSKLGVTLGAIYAFTGTLADKDGSVAKAGRNIIKTPLTAMVFGSSVTSAVDSMANGFVESIYAAIEDVSAGKGDVKHVIDNINVLLMMGKGPTINQMSIEQLMKTELSNEQVNALKKSFKDTLGKAVAETMKTDFNTFIEQRKEFNEAAQLSFEIYNAAYQGLRDAYVAELIKSGDLATDSKGRPIHDLTTGQEMELKNRVRKLDPLMHTLMSKESGSLSAGLHVSKSDRKLSARTTYEGEIKFGSKFADNGASSTTTRGYEIVETAPGVAMMVLSAHSADSAVSHTALDGNEVLNVHDAHGTGLKDFEQTARNLNKATWNTMLNYSPANEIAQTLSRVVVGLAGLMEQGDVPAQVIANLKTVLGETSLAAALTQAKDLAFKADNMRLEALGLMGSVDQYALEGGNYQVTEGNRAEAQAKRAALSKELSSDEAAALVQIASSLGQASTADAAPASPAPRTATVETAFGKVGTPNIQSEGDLVSFFEANPQASAGQVIELLSAPGRLTAINRKILQLVSRTVSPDLSIRFVTPETAESMVLDKPTTNARGWYVIKNGAEEIYVLSPAFVHSGLTSETLLHELVHAAIAKAIDSPTAAAKELIAELEALRVQAQEYAQAAGLNQFADALADVQEFAAWGMTNFELQRDVLSKITFKSTTGGNKLITGMQKFISTLTQLLFKKPDQNIDNGLSVLVSNVSGLFYQAAQTEKESKGNLNLAMSADSAIDAYTTLDIHNALDNGALEPSFKEHLANLLGGIVERLHGPFGALAAQMRKTEAGNPLAVWLKAMETGKAPFASAIVASGLAGSAQEDFAMQQIEATVKAALEGNEAMAKMAYKQLAELYKEARAKLKPSDFASQADYDFVFKLEADSGDRSDYLARFAALGLGNQKVNSLLKFNTQVNTSRFGEGQTLTERLENIFEKIVAFFAEKITHAYGGQQADQKLLALVDQLVDIEARKRHSLKLRAGQTNYLAPVEEGVKKATDAARAKISELAGSDLVRKNKNAFVRAAGGLARTYANDQVEWFLEGIQRLRDKEFKGRQGMVASLVTELKGPLDKFNALLRQTKHLEQLRKGIITQQAALALKMFKDEGKNLSKEAKSAVSAVFLRTGMHNLLEHFTSAEMENLLGNSTALDMSIDAFESQLTTGMKNLYIEQANALGFYKATGKARSPVLMLNAHLIARMAGTQLKAQVSEEEATQAEPILSVLVTLYALKYSSQEDQAAAKEVFRDENNRTDGNGVDFVLALHKKLEAESLERLFKGNPALMIHGYTPEILNPYTAIKIADAVDGQDLVNQGYSKGAQVPNDLTDPDNTTKHIYVLRDGGLAPWLSGVFSLSSMKAKGSKKHNGYLNVNNQQGLENAQLQATISNAKLTALQGRRDPRRDLSKQDGNHMVPVFNEMGDIVNWRYMMAETTKNTLLERDNRFENVLGALSGSIFDKATSREQNKEAILALREQYELEYATRADSYILVGERSTDPEMRAIWNLLPENTRRDARAIWGRNGMMVRSDSLDLMFGYRKVSLAAMFQKDPDARNKLESLFVGVMETVLANYAGYKHGLSPADAQAYAKRAAVMITRGERAWQELVHEAKDIIVVKTGFVMLGNIWSNLSLLAMSGVSLKDILHHHLVAMKGATAYQTDSKRLADLQTMLELGHTLGNEEEIKREIVMLKDAIARNPVKELIDAGLMPTIVEDVAADDDLYSYKSQFARKTEKYTDKLNPKVKAAARFVYMAHDTQMYQTLSKITQLSDFVARYTLYQHLINKAKDPLSKAEAIQQASDAFVNYDIPMHRGLQFSDDMGITPFTKYFLRIQRVLLKLTRENPARVFMSVALNNFLDLGPIVLDSSFVHHIGNNPIHSGAFQLPGALEELATVHAAMAMVK
jgi:hypothetical protein